MIEHLKRFTEKNLKSDFRKFEIPRDSHLLYFIQNWQQRLRQIVRAT